MSVLPGVWVIQRCSHRRSHERTYREDPTGTQRSACHACRFDTDLAYHLHLDDRGRAQRVCFNEYGACDEGTHNTGWIHKAKVTTP